MISSFFLACFAPEAPPVPYTPAECELAIEFVSTCKGCNENIENHAGYYYERIANCEDGYNTVLSNLATHRDALGVSPDRHWWCEGPRNANFYQYVPVMTPEIDSCLKP